MNGDRSNLNSDLVDQATAALLSAKDPGGPSPMLAQRTLAAVWAAEAKAERASGFRMRFAAALLVGAAGITIVAAFLHQHDTVPAPNPVFAIGQPTTRIAPTVIVPETQAAAVDVVVASAETLNPTPPLGEVSITGHVMFDGPRPMQQPIDITGYPGVSRSMPGPIFDDALVVNPDRSLANVIIYISGPFPAVKNFETPPPILVRQKYCMIEPHVVAAMIGQRLLLEDEDLLPHAIHSINCATTPTFNSPVVTRARRSIDPFAAVDTFQIGCEIHPWMRGWVRVFEHPYFDVTRSAGTFLIKDLPPGTYQLHAWHEVLGDQEKTITVNGGEPLSIDFSFEAQQ